MPYFKRISACARRLAVDRRAAVAPTFGLLLLPLLGMMGFTVDISMMLAAKTRAQNIADAGALDLIRYTKSYMDTNGNTTAKFNLVKPTAQSNATAFMTGLLSSEHEITGTNPTTTLAFAGNSLTAQARIDFNYSTTFMGLFGVNTVAMSVTAGSSSNIAQYTQVIFLIDTSGSMGMAATTTDMQNMVNLTSTLSAGAVPCAFACHQSTQTGKWDYAPIDFRTFTKAAGIQSKIDYAVNAVQAFTTQLAALSASAPTYFTTSVYTFGSTLTTVQAPTTNYVQINAAVAGIDLDTYVKCANATCSAWSATQAAMTSLKSKIKNVGDGSSATSMTTYLILVTDGVEDIYNSSATFTHQTDTTWTTACTAIKSMGVNLATVQAQYLPMTMGIDLQNYTLLVAPIASQITPAMTGCASSDDLALSASDGPGLQAAIQSLFAKVSATPRLTN